MDMKYKYLCLSLSLTHTYTHVEAKTINFACQEEFQGNVIRLIF